MTFRGHHASLEHHAQPTMLDTALGFLSGNKVGKLEWRGNTDPLPGEHWVEEVEADCTPHDALGHELLLCQAATAVKRSVGWFMDIMVLNTTLVMWRLRALIASVLVLPSARFFAR